jgi:3-oxoadipate CoA-transferase alpha subunit
VADKLFPSPGAAVADIPDGATVLVGGFTGAGSPGNLVDALAERGSRDLTLIVGTILAGDAVNALFANDQVRRLICAYPRSLRARVETPASRRLLAGEVALELVPLGTLVERVRAGGAGLPAFYTPVGAGTLVAEGKEVRDFDGRPCLLERALTADYALIRARRADRFGNLVYRAAGRNLNPIAATAGRIVIAEVEEVVETGALEPEAIVTPGAFVDRIAVAARRPERGR